MAQFNAARLPLFSGEQISTVSLATVPVEIFKMVCIQADQATLRSLSQTCRKFRAPAVDNHFKIFHISKKTSSFDRVTHIPSTMASEITTLVYHTNVIDRSFSWGDDPNAGDFQEFTETAQSDLGDCQLTAYEREAVRMTENAEDLYALFKDNYSVWARIGEIRDEEEDQFARRIERNATAHILKLAPNIDRVRIMSNLDPSDKQYAPLRGLYALPTIPINHDELTTTFLRLLEGAALTGHGPKHIEVDDPVQIYHFQYFARGLQHVMKDVRSETSDSDDIDSEENEIDYLPRRELGNGSAADKKMEKYLATIETLRLPLDTYYSWYDMQDGKPLYEFFRCLSNIQKLEVHIVDYKQGGGRHRMFGDDAISASSQICKALKRAELDELHLSGLQIEYPKLVRMLGRHRKSLKKLVITDIKLAASSRRNPEFLPVYRVNTYLPIGIGSIAWTHLTTFIRNGQIITITVPNAPYAHRYDIYGHHRHDEDFGVEQESWSRY